MFEGLIKFIEDTLFQRISRILKKSPTQVALSENTDSALTFSAKNPA